MLAKFLPQGIPFEHMFAFILLILNKALYTGFSAPTWLHPFEYVIIKIPIFICQISSNTAKYSKKVNIILSSVDALLSVKLHFCEILSLSQLSLD